MSASIIPPLDLVACINPDLARAINMDSAGTALLPAIAVVGSLTTGIFSPTVDTWAVSTAANERFRVLSTGQILMGITLSALGVAHQLEVSAGANANRFLSMTNPTDGVLARAVIMAAANDGVSVNVLQSISLIAESDLAGNGGRLTVGFGLLSLNIECLGDAAPITMTAGNAISGAAQGGGVQITGGVGDGVAQGGNVRIDGGVGGPTNGTGGDVLLVGGAGTSAGAGALVSLTGGSAPGVGSGGAVNITSGASVSGTAGIIQMIVDTDEALRMTPTESVFNFGILDRDFRVVSEDNSHQFFVDATTGAGNIAMFANAAPNFQNGDLIIFMGDATAPTGNPTAGGFLFSNSGAGTWRGSSGTVTTFALADPHCKRCGGRDFGWKWQNDKYGTLAICGWCLIEGVKMSGIDAVIEQSDKDGRNIEMGAQWKLDQDENELVAIKDGKRYILASSKSPWELDQNDDELVAVRRENGKRYPLASIKNHWDLELDKDELVAVKVEDGKRHLLISDKKWGFEEKDEELFAVKKSDGKRYLLASKKSHWELDQSGNDLVAVKRATGERYKVVLSKL